MARFLGREWTRGELRSYLSDPYQVAGASPCLLSDGKAEGVRAVRVHTGTGLHFTVLPGRAMDIPECFYKGAALHFFSATGITAPAWYEEPGLRWLRSFYAGLLTTCGITYSGAPNVDEGQALGLHGRIANAAAENVCISQEWEGDEYAITLRGTMREASVMGENITLTRTIRTALGARGFQLRDVIDNRGFERQPLMMLYHFNFGFPLCGPSARVVCPITATEPRDEEAARDRGVEECLRFHEPVQGYREKVFFHETAAGRDGRTFVALVNEDTGDGSPLGIVIRYAREELPMLTEWKMMGKGCYVVGLEPGTVNPLGRSALRASGRLPFLEAQSLYEVTIDFEVLESRREIEQIEKEAAGLAGGSQPD